MIRYVKICEDKILMSVLGSEAIDDVTMLGRGLDVDYRGLI